MSRSSALLAHGFLIAVAAQAADWPQWRGPNRDGVWNESGILETFPSNGLKVEWRTPVGFGFSSPIVAQGRVYVADSLVKAPYIEARMRCFDEKTGAPLWAFSQNQTFPEWAFKPGQEPAPNGTPVVRDGRIYAPGPNNHSIFCLDAKTGRLVWQRDLAKDYQIEETAALSNSPLVDGNRLILLVGGKPGAGVVALDTRSGKEKWRSLDEGVAHSSPLIIPSSRGTQLIVWTLKSVSSLNPATGKPFWREDFSTDSMVSVATPVVDSDRLLIGGLMLKLEQKPPSASVLWPESPVVTKRVLSSTSTALLQGTFIFAAGRAGKLVCLDATTGNQVWETDKVTDGKSGSSTSIHLTVNGDSVLLFTNEGVLIRARLGGGGYQEISRVQLIEPSYPFGGRKVAWAAPAFANRHVFVRNQKELICASMAKEAY